jgi:16S rRNA (uracil1498-N3)-methyltransferase
MSELADIGGKVRLYVESALEADARLVLNQAQSHYLTRVMRAREGDRVRLFNGRDGEWNAEIAAIGKKDCVLRLATRLRVQSEVPDIWLLFAPIKKTPADYVVQKATELGARMLQPVLTRRTIVTRVNRDRMCANAIEAAEQSERLTVPDIREAVTLAQLIASWPSDRRLIFCDEAGEGTPLLRALEKDASTAGAILTGPEGGFDPDEREQLLAVPSVMPVSLGVRILRADTAALAALALWQAAKGDWR